MSSKKKERKIIFKTPEQIKNIRQSWKLLNELLYLLYNSAKVWVNSLDLEKIAEGFMKQNNVTWSFKWYDWYPANLCLSVNECVVHAIPSDYILQNWDLLKIDTWVNYKWWISDSAISVVIWWEVANPEAFRLIKSTKKALDWAIKYVLPWKPIYDYSEKIFQSVTNDWFSILKTLTWHWVWVEVHEAPHVYNYPHDSTKKNFFQANMVVCLEPITAFTSTDVVEKKPNKRNLYTKNWDLWAQREYMVLITENGYEILSGITEDLF